MTHLKSPQTMWRQSVRLSLCCLLSAPSYAQSLHNIDISAPRLTDPEARVAYAKKTITSGDLENIPGLRLDDILRTVPGVGLFRRASSLVAHPTTQGITLRGFGPNGAGRALVLLDDIPLNDPFGGWVSWAALDPNRLEHIDIRPGSGAGPYGSQALSGVIRLTSRQPQKRAGWAEGRYGSFDSFSLSAGLEDQHGPLGLSLSAAHMESDGFILRTKEQRGPIDVPAASKATSIDGHSVWRMSQNTAFDTRIRWFSEDRTNGTPLARNDSEARDISMGFVHDGKGEGPDIKITAYWQDRGFTNVFSAVPDDARTMERPVLDQFDVPAWGLGGSALVRFPLADGGRLELGMDSRRLSGNTFERARNLGNGFTRLRQAGGDQWLYGGWIEYAGTIMDNLSLAGGVRFDHWRSFNGLLTESDLMSGAIVRADPIDDRKDKLVNGRLGLLYDATSAIRLRFAGYSGFRLPTINEFYRPFRVGNDITEANPQLDAERLYGLEAGLSYTPLNSVEISVDLFRNWLDRGVGNVTLQKGPGFFPPTGFVPAGGTLRQRLNIDHIIADGVALSVMLSPGSGWQIDLDYLFSNARITGFAMSPGLAGNRLAQSPKHSATLDIGWTPDDLWTVRALLHYSGDRFEDDMMERRLKGDLNLDLSISRDIGRNLVLFLQGQNITGNRVVSQIDGSGLLTRAAPRSVFAGLRARF